MATSDKSPQASDDPAIARLSNRELFYLLPPEMRRDLAELMGGVLASVSPTDVVDALEEFNQQSQQRTLRAYIEKQGVMGIVFKRPDPNKPSKINLVVRHQFMLEDVVRRYLRGGRLFALAGLHVKQVRVVFGNRQLDNPEGNCFLAVDTAKFPFRPRSPQQDEFRQAVELARTGDDMPLQMLLRRDPNKLALLMHSGLPYELHDGMLHILPPPRRGDPLNLDTGINYQQPAPAPTRPVEIQADDESRRQLRLLLAQLLQRLQGTERHLHLRYEQDAPALDLIHRYRSDFFLIAGRQGVLGTAGSGDALELRVYQRLEELGPLGQRLARFISTQVLVGNRSGILEDEDMIGFVLLTEGLRGFLLGRYRVDCVVPPLPPGKQGLPDNLWLYEKDEFPED